MSKTQYQVAKALISGISMGFAETVIRDAQVEHFNFAFDDDVFKKAYTELMQDSV